MHFDPDSSEEEEIATRAALTAAGATAAGVNGRKKQPFDKQRVLLAVLGREAPGAPANAMGCAQRLPSFFPSDVQQIWLEWARRTPSTLADVPEEHRLRHCRMPMKCLPAGASTAVEVGRVQRELITYRNEDGRSLGKTTLARDADALKPLYENDVKLGSTVAIKREPIDPLNKGPGGYNTPFYIGDVIRIDYVAPDEVMVVYDPAGAVASSSKTAGAPPRRIKSLQLHFRMPLLRNKFNDDVQKPWALACHGLHKWTKACEQTGECRRAAKAATGSMAVTEMLYVAEADELMEADVGLRAGDQITSKSRERLAEHGPADGSWRILLGLPASDSAQEKPSKRIRR